VENVLPGMQAAFVNIGLERNAFLYVDDVCAKGEGKQPIEKKLKPGEEVLVQVAKEPFGSKGARLTCQITLPGRFIVLMPTVDYIGISRRIEDPKERERLKKITEALKPKSMGLIVRTVAEGADEESLKQDIDFLAGMWLRMQGKMEKVKAPALMHQDLDLIYRIVRDLFTADIDSFAVDTPFEHEKIHGNPGVYRPLKEKVLSTGARSRFLSFTALKKRSRRPSPAKSGSCGGYLVIEQMEALTAIDVNTGRYIGKTNLAETILKTNLDAAEEIVRQIRLRDIGGIISSILLT
jgi:ribonuclease G